VDSQFTEELQLLSQRNSSWKWVAGVFFYHAINANDPGTTAFGGAAVSPTTKVTSVSNYASEGTVSTAGYGQVTKEVLPNTDLTLGFRYTGETRAISGYSTRVTTLPTPIAPTYVTPASQKTNTPTWRVALDHKFSDTVMAYISDSRGFKSGGYNLSNGNTPYAPEKLDAYEIGLKTELYEHRVTLNSSAFYYDYRNIQVSRYVNGAALIYNGAAATAFGMDIDVTAALSKRLILRAGVELIRDYFTSFKNADFFLTCPSGPTSVCSLSAVGKALPQTSAASGTINLDYLVPLPDDAGLNFDLNAAINSGYYFAPNNEDHQSGYGLLNGSIRWFSAGNRYEARLWGKNLTNEIYYLSVNQSPGSTAASFAAPRTVGISLGMKF
jgi:outer membrane receptor protein involved in Fe transport